MIYLKCTAGHIPYQKIAFFMKMTWIWLDYEKGK